MQEFIGKRVIVRAAIGRDNFGKRNGSIIEIGGICVDICTNEYLNIPLQIVLDRTPVPIKSMSDVKLFKGKNDIKII